MGIHPVQIALGLAALLALAACVAPQDTVPEPPQAWESEPKKEVLDLLAQSARRAADARQVLAMIERARTAPAPSPVDETMLPWDLQQDLTMNWSGTGEEAVRQIAGRIGYEFLVVGNPPASPPMVSVSALNLAAAKVLEDIGLQVQPVGQVVVDPNIRRIEFRYLTALAGATGPASAPSLRGGSRAPAPAITK